MCVDRAAKAGKDACAKVLQRKDLGHGRERAFWHAVDALHGTKGHVEEIPNMPCLVEVVRDEESEGGMEAKTPRPADTAQADGADASLPAAALPDSFVFRFSGAPTPMRPLLKQMVRFERPFITAAVGVYSNAPPKAEPGGRGWT